MAVNLRDLASEVAREEGLARSAGGVAQIAEIIGILGRRWRKIGMIGAFMEFMAIKNRAGKR